MPHADGPLHTQEEILAGLREVWRDSYGDEQTIDANTRIVERLRAIKFWEEFDAFEFAHAVDRRFICRDLSFQVWRRALSEPWRTFLLGTSHAADWDTWEREIAPRMTFGALAEFLVGHVNPAAPEPARILGRPCAFAGAFFAIERIANEIRPRVGRFAPSTPIRARFRGCSLRELWGLTRWLSLNRLPRLRPTIRSRVWDGVRSPLAIIAGFAVFGLVLAGAHAIWGLDVGPGMALAAITVGVLAVTLVYINRGLARFENPLPAGFTTFGDLARGVAQDSPVPAAKPDSEP